MGGWQDEYAEKDLEESQRGSGQDAPTSRCPLEQELLGRHPQWHARDKATGCCAVPSAGSPQSFSGNSNFEADGAERFAGVLGQCRELVHLNLSGNLIGADGTERLAGVLGQCPELAHFDFQGNEIVDAGAESLAGVLT